MVSNEFFGIASLVATLGQYLPYCAKIYKGELRPHIFSFVIWGVGAAIVAAAQWSENAGPGAWAMGLTAIFCVIVICLSMRNGTKYITKGDWITFAAAILAIPAWIATNDAFLAVLIVTLIDLFAFYMTFRKVLRAPKEESTGFYIIATLQYVLSFAAIASFSITTVLNPVALIATSSALIIAMLYLRMGEKQTEAG
jgi:hypothetical protein